MANLKPSELTRITSIQDEDIFIVEIEPNNLKNLKVCGIEKKNLFFGYINSAESLGAGISLLSGTDNGSLSLKTLVGGPNVTISDRGNDILINTDAPESTTASNLGLGLGMVSGIENYDLKIHSISGGSSIDIVESSGTFLINFTGQNELTTASNIGSGVNILSGISDYDLKFRSISGGDNIDVFNSGETVYIDFTGQSSAALSNFSSSTFAFFSNAVNNNGIIEKSYFDTPTQNTYLSGIDVDSASDVTLYLRWDGPNDSYVGSGSINGQSIPSENITELGSYTRRFEGFISGLDLAGQTSVTGVANGFTGIISLSEAGAGPTPLHVFIDDISNATPKAGENLGNSSLKGGDIINVFATFDTNDVTGIKVYDSGISNGIDYNQYSLNDTGDGNYTATIPITINSSRVGSQSISIVANNNFGTAGDDVVSSNSVNLDQTYPSISASNPIDYNGRSDGLRSGESATFSNSISNWSDGNADTVLYSGFNNDILISNSGSFENPKTVSYNDGIFNDSENVTISAVRVSNGATDSNNITVKIANGPSITGISLASTAHSATSPNVIGSSEIKGGDTLDAQVYVDGKGVAPSNIELYITDGGISDGSQDSFSSYSYTTLPDGSFQYNVRVSITSLTSRDGLQAVTMRPKNNFGTEGDNFTSTDTVLVNNSTFPILNISSINYPTDQEALKNSESATVNNTASNYDIISYTSQNNQLNISNASTFEASKTCSRQAGSYNVNVNNFTITATKSSNGFVRSVSSIVNIAHDPLSFSVNNLSSVLSSSPAGVSDNFNLSSSQLLLEVPSLETNPSQTVASNLITTASGTNTNSNNFRITVSDADTKGTFPWVVSGKNLAGIDTNTISTNPNYTLAGFSSRIVASNPSTALGRGLFPIGTSVSNPNDVVFENIAEGGSGPEGGTIYSYQSFSDGTQLVDSMDYDNKFSVCDSAGIVSSSGDHCYNLDKTIRDANTSTAVPATANIEEN